MAKKSKVIIELELTEEEYDEWMKLSAEIHDRKQEVYQKDLKDHSYRETMGYALKVCCAYVSKEYKELYDELSQDRITEEQEKKVKERYPILNNPDAYI